LVVSGNHWNLDVISNGNVAENRLPGPVSLAVVGKKVFLERKAWERDVPWRVIFHQVVGAFVRPSNRVTSHHHLGLGWLSVYQKPPTSLTKRAVLLSKVSDDTVSLTACREVASSHVRYAIKDRVVLARVGFVVVWYGQLC